MSTIKPIPVQQRRVRELQDSIDRVTDADLSYFARFPHRKHRMRVADLVEIELAELLGEDMSLLPRTRYYCAVRYLTPYSCLRIPVVGPADADPELFDEDRSRTIFKNNAPAEFYVPEEGQPTPAEMLEIIEALKK